MKKLLILLISTYSINTFASDAENIVDKMVVAMHSKSYQGTYVYLHGDKLETIRLEHINYHDLQKETLKSLTGEDRGIIRDENTVSCLLPSKKVVIIDRSRNQYEGFNKLNFHSKKIKNYYEFIYKGADRVAGRESHVVHISPKDTYRFAHTLWVDKENYLLLKSKVSDEMNQTIEQIMFTDIALIEDENLASLSSKNSNPQKNMKILENKKVLGSTSNWLFRNIPPGYKFKKLFKKIMDRDKIVVKQWLFSDGLTSYSIFIKAYKNKEKMPKDVVKMGSVNVLSLKKNDHLITIMGEVPKKTVIMASSGITKK